jgi:thioredoxin reductase (NADPH)
VLFEGFMAGGIAPGGQLTTTTIVENCILSVLKLDPGFPQGIFGQDLMLKLRSQSLMHGTILITETIESVDLSRNPFKLTTENGTHYYSKSLIIATGATAKRLGIPGEIKFWQKGISACAVCDGALPIFKNSSKNLEIIYRTCCCWRR